MTVKNECTVFTLIELLVVIVMILAGLLLPALKKAKETSLQITCKNKEKQLGIAVQMYAGDNNFYLPCGDSATSTTRGWENKLLGYLQANGSVPTQPCFHCPASKEGCIASPNTPNKWLGYGMNVFIANNYTTAIAGHRASANIAWIEHPSKFFLLCDAEVGLYDGTGREHVIGAPYTLTISATDTRINDLAWRHSAKNNFLLIDGHVESFRQAGSLSSSDTGTPDPIPDGIEFLNGHTYGG